MDKLKEHIIDISGKIAGKLGYFVIEVVVRGDSRKRIVEIFVDAEKNISADDLAGMSREIKSAIEEENIIKESYRLEVSTPGVDRPLKYLQQYPKHINRNLKVMYKYSEEEKEFTGKLISVNGNELMFLSGGKDILIKFNSITTAKVLISFS